MSFWNVTVKVPSPPREASVGDGGGQGLTESCARVWSANASARAKRRPRSVAPAAGRYDMVADSGPRRVRVPEQGPA